MAKLVKATIRRYEDTDVVFEVADDFNHKKIQHSINSKIIGEAIENCPYDLMWDDYGWEEDISVESLQVVTDDCGYEPIPLDCSKFK